MPEKPLGKSPPLGPVDLGRIERAVREILLAIGENPDREGLAQTPQRVAKSYSELMAGLREDPRQHLKTVFHERYDEIVLLRDIEFYSLCEHHLLPFMGRAHVAYLPDGKVVGLSKLARLVEGYARRPQVQERLTTQIADAVMEELERRRRGLRGRGGAHLHDDPRGPQARQRDGDQRPEGYFQGQSFQPSRGPGADREQRESEIVMDRGGFSVVICHLSFAKMQSATFYKRPMTND